VANLNSGGFTRAIHTLLEVGTLAGLSDGQLLELFAARRTEAAFAALVARHGAMVLSVCESLLGDAHDAEDAFQATFLVLAKRARSIRDPYLLGNWLHGVARRTAQKAEARRARRRVRAGREEAMYAIAVADGLAEIESVRREETAMLHEEVDRLPESLRAPIVLCYLEGLTHGEAAFRLRWPIGTVRSRMARGRGLLRARLTRRGLAYAAIAAAIESPRAVRAEVPQALAHTTARSAIELATGTASGLVSTPAATLMKVVLQAMFMTQLKRIVATALAVVCIATGAGIIAMGALPPPSGAQGAQAAQAADQRAVEGNRAGPTIQTRELLALQERIRSSSRTAVSSIVSFIGATGVIISPEGLILSQAHVTHPAGARTGAKTEVRLHDDTVVEAELLGADRVHDLSLLRLVKPGPYPFIPLADRDLAPGEGVLKLGYPGPLWYRKGRPPEVRFGRVLATNAYTFLVDCHTNGGDSGGPFVDLDGRLVGILKASTPLADDSLPAGFPNIQMPRGSLWWTATASTMIRTRLARMEKGKIIEATNAELAQVPATRQYGTGDLIAEERRTQGKDSLGRFRGAVADVRGSVVEILDGDEPVARGTVVDTAGLVITKASEVPDEVRCRLPDGRMSPAQVVGVDPAYDLALLRLRRVPTNGLVAVNWAKTGELPAGTLLAAAGIGELPVAVGVVSIPRRDRPGPHPSAAYRYQRNKRAAPPALTGSTVTGVGYRVETSEGNAAAAGIRPGDVILTIAGSPVPENGEIRRTLGKNRYLEASSTFRTVSEGRLAGERVPVRLLRGGRQIVLTLELKKVPDPEIGSEFVSDHADVPPTVITADIPVLPDECGAPAVGVDGTVVGLVISRFGVTGSFIIPGDRVAARLADLKAGKPLAGFPAPAANPPASGARRE
jgi:RNA polymerase sigma factor (sigma-70 family)